TVTPEAEKYSPSYDSASVQAGDQVVLIGKDLPASATYSVVGSGMTVDAQGRVTVVVPVEASTGQLAGNVTVRYSDGSQDQVAVVVHVTAKPMVIPEAEKYSPSYETVEAEQGQLVELNGQGLPPQATYTIVGSGMRVEPNGLVSVPVPSDAEVGNEISGQLTVRYEDGSEDLVPIKVRVKAKAMTEAEKFAPSYDVMEVQAGDSLIIPGNNLPTNASYSVNGLDMTIDAQGRVTVVTAADAPAASLQGQVRIRYSDGSEDLVPITVQVIAKSVEPQMPEADKYSPSYIPVEVHAGTQVTIPGIILPASATYTITGQGMTVDTQGWVTIRVPADAVAGEVTGQVTVRYSDGSEDQVPVKITVKVSEEPVTPVEPERPVEPEEPVTPVEPEKPVEPGEPVIPVEPEKPVEPDEP
ncbi:Rib/alpha-like domain-containing protein, partial [Streptococcus danieliae]|uniref:Rib/alpha-like domain-containing protein n=1 Tax=Streptococcus danieliae TaxID=747656 RepID=UPI0026F0DD37